MGVPLHAEASGAGSDPRVVCRCIVAAVEGVDVLALVDRLHAPVREFAWAVMRTVMVSDRVGPASTTEEGLDESIASKCPAFARTSALGSFDASLGIDAAGTPLVGDGLAPCRVLALIETIWHLIDAHRFAAVVALASILEINDLIAHCYLLAFRIIGLFPVGPARPRHAVRGLAFGSRA